MTIVETYFESGRWHFTFKGWNYTTNSLDKELAINQGKFLTSLCKAVHIIKNMDGTIAHENSYKYVPWPFISQAMIDFYNGLGAIK